MGSEYLSSPIWHEGTAKPMLAALAMSFGSIAVIANALRLRNARLS